MAISCSLSKRAPVRASGFSLLPPQSPSGFSSFSLCAPNQNHHATQAINILNYFTVPPKQWEDVFLLLSYTGMQSIFFFQKTDHALIALWKNRLMKYYLLFNRGYVVIISAQPWPEIEEFSLTFKVLDLTALFTNMRTLKFKSRLHFAFFAAVNHNYDHKQRTLKHRNTQNASKSTTHQSQTMTFWTR